MLVVMPLRTVPWASLGRCLILCFGYLFSDGPAPDPYESCDTDCSGDVDIDDVVYTIAYIFSGGSAPCDTDGDGVPDC